MISLRRPSRVSAGLHVSAGSDEVRDHDRQSTPSQDASENLDGATEIDLPPER